MRPAILVAIVLSLVGIAARAEVAPVAVRVPQPKAWTGQRLPFFVELRARGAFSGVASFSLPQIPGTVLVKAGNPVVSSAQIEGESWFVQTHELALFSQHDGEVEIPAFAVRFGRRNDFTGPVEDVEANVPAVRIEIERPPGSEDLGFVVTSESVDVTETWEPQPGPVEVGAIFKRTIGQRAEQVTGMALPPAPASAPDGIRVYAGPAEVTDETERGQFRGERRETLTYLVERAGTYTLPALRYVWWNPKTEQLESTFLPAVTLEAAAGAAPPSALAAQRYVLWVAGLAAVAVLGRLAWQRERVRRLPARFLNVLNPPHRAAARRLLRACGRDDALAASLAWLSWVRSRPPGMDPSPALQREVLALQRHLFGPSRDGAWRGQTLAVAFRQFRHDIRRARHAVSTLSALPPLNP